MHALPERWYPSEGQDRTNLEGATQWMWDIYEGKVKLPENFFDPRSGALNIPLRYVPNFVPIQQEEVSPLIE